MSRVFVFFLRVFSKNFQQVIDICRFVRYNIVINGICRLFVEKRRKRKNAQTSEMQKGVSDPEASRIFSVGRMDGGNSYNEH